MNRFALAATFLALPLSVQAQSGDGQPTGKLPDTVKPLAYRLDFTIDPDQARFSGHTEIDIDLKRPAQAIWMHGRDLRVTRAVVRIGDRETPVRFAQKSPFGLAQIEFGQQIKPGKMTLKFDYDAAFTDGPAGLYRINVEDSWYSWSQFESIDARAAFPSFDEPGYKTPFEVSITTKPGYVALSNAPEIGKGAPAGSMVKHRFAPTLPLPTYLVALVTGPFVTAESTVAATPQRPKPLPLRVVGTKPNADKLQYALEHSKTIVQLLERYFDQAFPFPKLDQIGSPVMPGAMENAGADIYGDSILFLDEASSTGTKQTFGMVVAHELAHQWFGDLVTPAWWDDIWLNESFANWMGYRIGNEWRPDLNIGVDAIGEAFDAMQLDALAAGRPIHEKITSDGDIDAAFDQITYGKGGQVVAMIAAYLGDAKFRDGVLLHMKRHTYGNATTDEFFAALADGAKDPRVLASLRSFVDQQGVPLVTLRRENGGLSATQSRYGYFGTNLPSESWIIPLCVRQGETKDCTLIDQPRATVALKGNGAFMPNAGGWGYYRFELDPADWDALIATGARLPEGEALALDDSLWASFYAGRSPVQRAIALARATSAHPASKIMFDNAHRLRDLDRRGLVTQQALPAYRKLFVDLYGPALTKLGFDPAADVYAAEANDQRELRHELVDLVGVTGRDAATRSKLTGALDGYLGGHAKALSPGYLGLATKVAVNERGVTFAKTLLERALDGQDPALSAAATSGVGTSGNADVARWFLNDFKDERLDPRQRLAVVSALMNSPYTRDLALDFMITNFDAFVSQGGGGGIFSGRAVQMFGTLCSNAHADAVDAKLRPGTRGSTLNLDRAVETIRTCARFRDAKAGEVSSAIMSGR